jgi:uncharacterized Zn-binding protein involved in type VI secretion
VSTNLTVFISARPAWRGIPAVAAGPLRAAHQATDAAIKTADAAALAATGTPAGPGLEAAALTAKTTGLSAMSAAITSAAAGTDIHTCTQPLPPVPHGPGLVITPSNTVFLAGKPAARQGDTILEALGPPNTIISGALNVLIGG